MTKEKLNVKSARNKSTKHKELVSFRHIPARVIIRLRSEDSVTNFKMTLDDTSVLEFFQTGPGAGVFGFNQR